MIKTAELYDAFHFFDIVGWQWDVGVSRSTHGQLNADEYTQTLSLHRDNVARGPRTCLKFGVINRYLNATVG